MPGPKPGRCAVSTQAVIAGTQHVTVRSFSRTDGWDTPYLSIKVGRVLFNIEDREALNSLSYAIHHAELIADHTFGPVRHPAA